jgi:uncharacterized OsmC-like protein
MNSRTLLTALAACILIPVTIMAKEAIKIADLTISSDPLKGPFLPSKT